MHYYQDRVTCSIYSDRELVEMTQAKEITPRELLVRFDELPEHKRRLLEEAEAAAAERRQQHPERSLKPATPWRRFSSPGF
jgi:hypothetical protein